MHGAFLLEKNINPACKEDLSSDSKWKQEEEQNSAFSRGAESKAMKSMGIVGQFSHNHPVPISCYGYKVERNFPACGCVSTMLSTLCLMSITERLV